MSKLEIVEMLLNDQSYHIEFNGFLTNHAKQGVVALMGLGASAQRIKEYYEHYAKQTTYGFGLETPKISEREITQNNWQVYFGKHCSFTSYCEVFDQKEKELGMDRLLEEYVPILLPGCVGSLMHGTIHLGWGLDSGNRWMIIEGLAYMAFSYVSCQPEKIFSSTFDSEADKSILGSLLHMAEEWETNGEALDKWRQATLASDKYIASSGFHPELSMTGFQYDIAKVLTEGHPLIHTTPAWIESLDMETIWRELYEGTTLLYLAKPGDFIVLHLITSLHGMEQIVNRIPAHHQKRAIKCYWTAMLGIVFSDDDIPTRATLEALHSKYQNTVDQVEAVEVGQTWDEIIARAIIEEEEHNPKLVYVQRLLWKRFGHRSLFRDAASKFTTTPKVSKIETGLGAGVDRPC
ncbi:MAG: questin oxidase family protein [Candidatus Nitronauta litoralis]|uniref:Questin oxidase family protein n=1 Tax=Candidatus Nitronauta litoralis TaxID=2705533 RepID=A0A7T0BWP7_9BACT|nr:MAG: questin oxidase family protein [Candidatus Nitronauta litoralis]